MKSLQATQEERRKQLNRHLKQADRLHENGDLDQSLAEFRKALQYAYTREEVDKVNLNIQQLRALMQYVTNMESEDKSWMDRAKDLLHPHVKSIWISTAVVAGLMTVCLSVPPLVAGMQENGYLQSAQTAVDPSELEEETVAEVQHNAPLRSTTTSSGPARTTRVTSAKNQPVAAADTTSGDLTLPTDLSIGQTVKYVIRNGTPLFDKPNMQALIVSRLASNAPLRLLDQQEDARHHIWLMAESPAGNQGWVPAQALKDVPTGLGNGD